MWQTWGTTRSERSRLLGSLPRWPVRPARSAARTVLAPWPCFLILPVSLWTAGDVYVADAGNETIRKITPAGVVTTLAGTAGQSGSADGTGAAARFFLPTGVAVDSEGNVYVADAFNDAIRKITPSGVVTTLAGPPGQAGSADGTGAAAELSDPNGVAVDGAGNVYVADSSNDTVLKLSIPTVLAQSGVTGNSPMAVSAALSGLAPGTTYYYRVVATSVGGTMDGTILSFTTTVSASPPVATTEAATGITTTAATMNASVNPEGSATTVSFVYGTSASLTAGATTTSQSSGSGTDSVSVSARANRPGTWNHLLLPGGSDKCRRYG